jgi:hypothetical protein
MRYLAALLLMLSLASCAKSETDSLRDENTKLKQQLETVTMERDGFKAQLDRVREALNNTAPATDPATGGDPSSSTPDNPSSSATPPSADPPATVTPPSITAPTEPNAGNPPSSGSDPSPVENVTKLKAYADNVLSAAQNFKAQNQKEPPTECAKGYKAGDYTVEDKDGIAQSCTLTIKSDGSYSVQVSDGKSNSVSVP